MFSDFELDLVAALPAQWQALIEDPHAGAGAAGAAGTGDDVSASTASLQRQSGGASGPAAASPQSYKLRSRLLRLVNSGSTTAGLLARNSTGSLRELLSCSSWQHQHQHAQPQQQAAVAAASAAARQAAAALPGLWARKLETVVEVLQLAGEEQGRLGQELQGGRQRMQLLESNIDEVGCTAPVPCLVHCLVCSTSNV